MAKKKTTIPQYGTVMRKGVQYYRTRILDADGKQVSLYATTCEELYEKQAEAKRQVEEIIFHREHPTVAEYCEKWLLMQSAKVSAATLKGYTSNMNNYIIKPMGDMYMEEVTADDIRLALVPLSKKSAGLYNTVNMLIKCIFYSAERSQLLQHNPCVGISSKGGKPIQKKEALTDQQVKVLLDTVKGLPPQLFVMIGLYSGLRREEALALQWDCVFLDAPTPYISVRRAWRTEHNRPLNKTEVTKTFEISKVSITITADSKQADAGAAKPALTYTVTGLVGGDTLAAESTLTCNADMDTIGQYPITASGAAVPSGGNSTIVARPDEAKPEIPTASQTKPVKPDAKGNVTVDNGAVQSAINAAKEDAKKNGNTANGVAVVIPITPKEGQNSFNVTINAQTLNTLVRENVKRLEINLEGVVVGGMDTKLLKWLDTLSANGDVIFRVKQTDPSGLSKEAKAAIGTRPAYDLSLVYLSGGKETPITDFDGHTIAVRLPYAPAKEEQTGNLYAVYVDSKGKVEWLTKSSYDPDLGGVVFETGHFSIYGIGYKTPASAFTDIKNHWAGDNIIFVASRGLLAGTGNKQFSPDTGMTRGMFVTALGRLAGIDPDSYQTGKFTDVKADAYYAPYVNWAAEKGVINGTTATTFSPDTNITREQMAVILAGYVKKLGYALPAAHEAVAFADNAQISGWAAKEVKAMQQAGIMAGKGGNRFDPREAATVLRRLVEVVIDPQTAQGWVQNNSGSWQYMRNGKPASGWEQIGGKWYYFYSDGVRK